MYEEVATIGWLEQSMETLLQKSTICIGFRRSLAFEGFCECRLFQQSPW